MAEPNIRGLVFPAYISFLRRTRGEDAVTATLERLPPELAHRLREDLFFTVNWYPIAWYRDLHHAAQQATGEGLKLAHDKGFDGVTGDLSGIYKVFLMVVSPAYVIGRAARLFSKYYDTGSMEIVEAGSKAARARWRGCAGFDRNIWVDVRGGCEAALAAAGARNIQFTVVSGGEDGNDHMEVEATWE